MKVRFYKRLRNWRWTITAENGEKVGASTEGYRNKDDAVSNFQTVTSRVVVDGRAGLGNELFVEAWDVQGLDD